MENREKKKTSKLHRVRPRLNLSIDPENHEYLKEIGVNASRLLDNAVSELRKITPRNLVLISQNRQELWAWSDSNARTSPCKGDVITRPVSGLGAVEAVDEISKTSRGVGPEGMLTISEYMNDADRGIQYLEYANKTGTHDAKTRRSYLAGLRKLQPIRIPTDISEYKTLYGMNITSSQRKGLQKFFKFLRVKELKTEWNGYDISQFLDNLSIAEQGDPKMSSRLKDLTSAEIRAARKRLPEPIQVYFSLVAYSGARHTHLYKALEKKRPIERVGDAIRIDVRDLSGGTKREAYFYFPAEMERLVTQYQHPFSEGTLQRMIAASGTEGRPVNVSSLRKWNYNQMRTGKPTIDATAADHIQGRSPKTVGDRHYADLDKIAAEGYNLIVPKLLKELPIPTPAPEGLTPPVPEMEAPPAPEPKGPGRREGIKNPIARKNKKPMNEKELDRMLRAGMTHAQIIEKLPGANKTKIAAYVKDHPELKRK